MYAWILAASLACGAGPLENGSLLFLENCNSVVQRVTHGEVGHVAIVMHDGGEAWVYEATPGQVRRVKADDYYAELSQLNARKKEKKQIRAYVARPEKPYDESELAAMRRYLEAQVGRRYSVKNYVKGREGDGVHCAELASHTLNQSGRYSWEDCYSISPARLHDLVDATYAAPVEVKLPSLAEEETWCQRMTLRWQGFCRWCDWSCSEAWYWW